MPGGRPPKPTQLKVLHGTNRPDRANPDEPQPTSGIPACPGWLSAEAKREWRKITPELHRLGLLTVVDGAALAAYCQAAARVAEAERVLSKKGTTIELTRADDAGEEHVYYVQQRPEVAIAKTYYAVMRAFLTGFGLDPASRSKLRATPAGEADPFADFLKRGKHGPTG